MKESKPTGFLLLMSHTLYGPLENQSDAEVETMQSVPYRDNLGMLLFILTRTRPDLATSVSMLGNFQPFPTLKHWRTIRFFLRYLRGTSDYGIFLQNGL